MIRLMIADDRNDTVKMQAFFVIGRSWYQKHWNTLVKYNSLFSGRRAAAIIGVSLTTQTLSVWTKTLFYAVKLLFKAN